MHPTYGPPRKSVSQSVSESVSQLGVNTNTITREHTSPHNTQTAGGFVADFTCRNQVGCPQRSETPPPACPAAAATTLSDLNRLMQRRRLRKPVWATNRSIGLTLASETRVHNVLYECVAVPDRPE